MIVKIRTMENMAMFRIMSYKSNASIRVYRNQMNEMADNFQLNCPLDCASKYLTMGNALQ